MDSPFDADLCLNGHGEIIKQAEKNTEEPITGLDNAGALGELTHAARELAHGQGRLITAMFDVACEQRITNLIVRSQITADRVEKARLMSEASRRMGTPRRRSPHDSL